MFPANFDVDSSQHTAAHAAKSPSFSPDFAFNVAYFVAISFAPVTWVLRQCDLITSTDTKTLLNTTVHASSALTTSNSGTRNANRTNDIFLGAFWFLNKFKVSHLSTKVS